ncbi:MAG TPA: FecR family protein [Pseudomonadales bacterium]|nr:FecR family protein [Pseudomonadales bacterium]
MRVWIVGLLGLALSININAAEEAGTTVFTRGDVLAATADGERELERRDPIFQNERLNTGEDARAVFRLTDDTVVTLGENADVLVEDYQFDDQDKRLLLNVATGAFRVVTGKLTLTDKPNFTVKSQRSTIAVRGTDFWGGSLHGPGSLDVALLEGEHPLVVSNDFGTVEITTPGFGTTIYPGKAPEEPRQWPADMVQQAVQTISY